MRLRAAGAASLSLVVVLAAGACTYGPTEEQVRITQVVRIGDSYRAVAVVQHDVWQRPTGLNTFPDGGSFRFLERRSLQFLLDAEAGLALPLASQEAPDSLWESFNAHVVGVDGDSAAYLRLTGCPRRGECYPALSRQELLRLAFAGGSRPADGLPPHAVLPGTMLSRAPGEQRYVRFGVSGDTITVRLEEEGPYRPAFLAHSNGTVTSIGG